MSISREQIAQYLSFGAATVKFVKVNGSDRVMHCTIANHLIPEEKRVKGELLTEVPINLDVMRVFDLDLNEWRSFKVQNVKEVAVGYYDGDSEAQLLSE